MSGNGEVLVVERTTDEGVPVVNVEVDPGGGANETIDHVTPAGIDSLPLRGDIASRVAGSGTGGEQAVGYLDPKNAGKAKEGEFRAYARATAGDVVVELWLKNDGSLEASNGSGRWALKPDGSIDLNGFVIDPQGNATTPGDVTAKAESTPVTLSSHLHPTGTGPSGPPQPGT